MPGNVPAEGGEEKRLLAAAPVFVYAFSAAAATP